MLPEILVMSPEKKSQVARRNKYLKDLNFRLEIGNNVEKALLVSDSTMKILKALFFPKNKGKRCSFPTTKCSVVRLVCNRFLLTDVS